jgi:hypothetical protein
VSAGIGAIVAAPYARFEPAEILFRGQEMEARRTFQGEAKSSRIYIVVAALLAAIALGLGGGFAAKGLGSASGSATKAPVVVKSGNLYTEPDQNDHSWMSPKAAPYVPSHKRQTVF